MQLVAFLFSLAYHELGATPKQYRIFRGRVDLPTVGVEVTDGAAARGLYVEVQVKMALIWVLKTAQSS